LMRIRGDPTDRLTDWAERQGRYGLKDKQAEMGNQGIDGQDGPWGT
jgi:hypothetical protein